MATSAFKSTTKRTSIGTTSTVAQDSASSARKPTHRRSNSLGRFSDGFPPADSNELPAPRRRFVNTVRGSAFPEISLDDLANDFFPLKDAAETESDRGRSARRCSAVSPSTSGTSGRESQRRVRSVSRHRAPFSNRKDILDNTSRDKGVSANSLRKRRSASVSRCHFSDSESDFDHSQNSGTHTSRKNSSNGISQRPSLQKSSASSHHLLRRSLSQKDLLKSHDGYSSHSSALTDDEGQGGHSNQNGNEKTIRAVYSQTAHPAADRVETELHEVMRKELRHAVEDIRTELEQVMLKAKSSVLPSDDCLKSNSADVFQAVSMIRRSYSAKLEQSEKRKQDLLAEIVFEEQRGRDLSHIVRELLPDTKTSVAERPTRARKRSNDRSRISKHLIEEAEKYFEDFISNVEDTDISSFDGERSDTSSTQVQSGELETSQIPARSSSLPVEMDGVVLPWLQWETCNDSSPLPCKSGILLPVAAKSILCDGAEVASFAYKENNSASSSCGSWSPGGDSPCVLSGGNGNKKSWKTVARRGFDMEEYLEIERREEAHIEVWRQRQRINTGGIVICCNSSQLL